MTKSEDIAPSLDDWPPIHPWPFLAGEAVAACLLIPLGLLSWSLPAAGVLLGGLLAGAGAVTLRPGSPAILAAAGALALVMALGMSVLARLGFKADWDSIRLVVFLLAYLALFAAFLRSLPSLTGWAFVKLGSHPGTSPKQVENLQQRGQGLGRILSRALISFLVIVHFSGIASSVLSVASAGRDGSWLAQGIWSLLQPYLQFCYLTNAYRFYSPEPGPPSLVWFHVEYADGSSRWVKIPGRKQDYDPMGQEYTRRLSIAESVNQLAFLQYIPEHVRHKRAVAGRNADIPLLNLEQQDTPEIPSPDLQRRVPNEAARQLLSEFARYVAQNYPSERDPQAEVTGIKIYRVIHRILEPRELADPNSDPTDPTTYWPYYQGEYTKEGQLKDPEDPFLFWLIPIYRQPRLAVPDLLKGPNAPPVASPGGYIIRDCLEIHAKLKTTPKGK